MNCEQKIEDRLAERIKDIEIVIEIGRASCRERV